MATVYGAEYTNVLAHTLEDIETWGGAIHVKHATYTAAALVDTSIIEMVDLKAGDVVMDVILTHEALGTLLTLDVGITTTDNALFIEATDVTAAAIVRTDELTGFGYVMTQDDTIDITVDGTGSITGAITLTVFYVPVAGA